MMPIKNIGDILFIRTKVVSIRISSKGDNISYELQPTYKQACSNIYIYGNKEIETILKETK